MKEINKDGFCIRKLSLEEILSVYWEHAVKHFPQDELKPAESIRRMYDAHAYEALALYKEKELAGYAFFAKKPDSDVLLLDYYAVVEQFRNSGIGSFFLQAMREYYSEKAAILIETEQVHKAKTAEEKQMRQRRNAFYERNGCRQTTVWCQLFSVDFGIFTLPIAKTFSDKQVFEELDAIYRYMFAGGYYEKFVKIGF